VRERLVTLASALGALLLFAALFLQGDSATRAGRELARPTTAERRGNGYYAAATWLEGDGVRVISLRERLGSLARRRDLPASGNLLIVTLPAAAAFRTEEFVPLDRWVRSGNTLLILAALTDSPDWAFLQRGLAPADLNLLSGLTFESLRARTARVAGAQNRPGARRPRADRGEGGIEDLLSPFLEPQRLTLLPNREHAYLHQVTRAVALSDYAHQAWTLKLPYDGFALELAHEDGGSGVLWTRPLGAGRIVVSAYGSLFTNRAIGLADNARLLANLIGASVSEHGAVLFDDAHQGLSAAYDVRRFYRDRRLYETAAILLALWLVWVLGSTRLTAAVRRIPAPRESDLVVSTGGFLARVVRTDAAARRLLERFLERIPASAAGVAAAWRYLEQHPRVPPPEVRRLQGWYADAYAGRRVPLARLQNLIVRIERGLHP
jgi:Domain of unknown function (DUF4350)